MPDGARIRPIHGPTLSKLGADLRWFLEQSRVDADQVIFSIGVKSMTAQSHIISSFFENFDERTMQRVDQYPNMVMLHGIQVWCIVDSRKENA